MTKKHPHPGVLAIAFGMATVEVVLEIARAIGEAV